ncbi:hypothetical protein HETIRDRAFT_389544, partial [Heterobasidion irregulare TC 32-1]
MGGLLAGELGFHSALYRGAFSLLFWARLFEFFTGALLPTYLATGLSVCRRRLQSVAAAIVIHVLFTPTQL